MRAELRREQANTFEYVKHPVIIRMSESQRKRLEEFQRLACLPTLSAAARVAIELGMTSDRREPGTVNDDGQVGLICRGDDR